LNPGEPSPDPRQRLGREGERAAEDHLRRSGLLPAARRFRTRHGEIDLIATQGRLVVFVEVKTRRGPRYGSPAEAVTPLKRRRMALVALAFLQRRRWLDRPSRFDVVEVWMDSNGSERVRHIEDAFRLDGREGKRGRC